MHIHDTHTINPYFYVGFCELNAHTIFPASVGLAQAHPNKWLEVEAINFLSNVLYIGT